MNRRPEEGGFWNERVGLRALRQRLLDRGIPSSVGWWHTLGSVNLSLLAVLALTGILLTLNYSPSAEHAYHSVRYVQTVVPLGWAIRGLHHWSASFLVVGLILHLAHTFATHAFTRPRELTWVSGAILLVIVLGFAFTGYLLPWDQKAYWATVVGTSMAQQVPLVGDFLLTLVRGGSEVGALTLSRFYGSHVTLLPALLALFVLVHLSLVVLHGIRGKEAGPADRRHGPATAHPTGATSEAPRRTVPFWPDVVAKDTAAILIVFVVLLWVALSVGAPLQAPADPTDASYVPRPEWYFLPLFQLLTYLPGSAESVGAVGIPLLILLALFTVPAWTRGLLAHRHGAKALLGAGLLSLGGAVWLGWEGAASTPSLVEVDARVPRGKLLYEQMGCVNCHSIRGIGGVVGPDLTLVGLLRPDSVWLRDHLVDPNSLSPATPMPAFPLAPDQLDDVVAFLQSLGNDLRYTDAAPGLFQTRCAVCHSLGGAGGAVGPDLTTIGSVRSVGFIHQYVENPKALNPDAVMPPAAGLSHQEVEDISRYIVARALASVGDRRLPEP